MKKLFLLFVLGYMLAQNTFGQGVAINTTGSGPDSSAMFDVSSTNKGILIPRMTMAQRNLIPAPANSLLIFQTDNDSGYYYYNAPSAVWLRFATYQSGQNPFGTCLSIIPQPAFPTIEPYPYDNLNSNTTAHIGQVIIPFGINVNKITVISYYTVITPGKVKVGIYSESGLKIFEVTSDTISNIGPVVINLNSVSYISPGNYYAMILPVNSANLYLGTYRSHGLSSFITNPAAGNILQGEITVGANTLPAQFSPTSISYAEGKCLIFRLN